MLINERYLVNQHTMTVTDTHGNINIKLEPRHMKLLFLFTEHAGVLISREKIINDIWDNYGGADEGLNQAVSFLRKTLNDSDKTLIKTIPKNGYIFDARVSHGNHQPGEGKRSRTWLVLLLIVLALLAVFFLFLANPKTGPSEPPGTVIDSGHPSQEQKELQYRDTVTNP